VRALENRRFRWVLLGVAGVPVAATYAWQALILPIFFGGYLGDFQESYLRAAARIASGQDPYDLCATMGCLEPTGPQYVMPPVLAWILQPLVGVDAHTITVATVLALNASLGIFLWVAVRTLCIREPQLAVLLVLVAIAFEPVVGNVQEGQVNLVLLGLSGIWFAAWVEGGRWWGGVALGAAVAVKLIQGPVVLLVLWGRRWAMLAAAGGTGLLLWLAGAPQYLFEYLFKVLPAVSSGTGFFENHSPGGTITRLFDPNTFVAVRGSDGPARALTALVAVAVIVVTFALLRSTRDRMLEAAAIVAATPLIASYSWGTHLVLLLLPMFVLITWAVRRGHAGVLALVATAWVLIGPVHKLLQVLLVGGYSNILVLRLLAEAGVVGLAALWIATLVAVRRSADRFDAADEGRAEDHEHHGARQHDPIAPVPVRTVE
jgi:Glycosyltransferase family 87